MLPLSGSDAETEAVQVDLSGGAKLMTNGADER